MLHNNKSKLNWMMYGRADRSVYDGWVLIASGEEMHSLHRARHFWDSCYDEIKIEFSNSEQDAD